MHTKAYLGSITSRCSGNEYCNADRTTRKLALQDINTTPKELKTERDCSCRQRFRLLWGKKKEGETAVYGYNPALF